MPRSILAALSAAVVLAYTPQVLHAAPSWDGAQWVWDETGATSNEPRYFRATFSLKAKPKKATLQITADNQYEAMVNGLQVGTDGNWNDVEQYDVGKWLVIGRNTIGVRATNGGGPAGLLARLVVTLDGKQKPLVIGTSQRWKTSRAAAADWTAAGFDDGGWQAAVILGGPESGPWNLVRSATGGQAPQDSNVSSSDIKGYRPASEEQQHFILPEGFEIELVAAEPLVINPVCLTLDEQGRMYVSESHTYRYGPGRSPVKEPTNPIVRLDPLPDGSGYRRVTVAEGFEDPVMGMVIRDGKLWCTANNFLFTFDLTESGPAENKKTLLIDKNKAWNPFGMFVLEWGPEGSLYLSVGNHNIDIGPPDQPKGEGITGRGSSGIVLRMREDGTELERLVHGLRVPYSYDYDPFGQLWLLSNGQGNPNRFVRVIEGVDYHCYSRGQVGNEWLAGRHPLAPPCLELPRGACTQLLRYYGAAFPADYQGSLFLDNWGAHGFAAANRTLHRYVPDHRNNIVSKEDFLVCRDPHFRCSHVVYAPDGNLLIADWYGRDDESDLTGRIWKVVYKGAASASPPNGSIAWEKRDDAIAALDSPHHAIRQKAMRILADNPENSVPALRQHAAGAGEAIGAASALWSLTRIAMPQAVDALAAGVEHADWRVRKLSLRLLRRYASPQRDTVARKLLADADPAVRLEAALCLERSRERAAALMTVLQSDAVEDEHLRYEAAWHLAAVAAAEDFHRLLLTENASVRLAGLIAIDVAAYEQTSSKDVALETLAEFVADPREVDVKLLLELVKLHRGPAMIPPLLRVIESTDVPPSVTANSLLLLRSISSDTAVTLDRRAILRFLEAVKNGTAAITTADDALTLLELLEADGPSEFALSEIARRVGDKDVRVRRAALSLAARFGHDAAPLAPTLWQRILDVRPAVKVDDKLACLSAVMAIEARPDREKWSQLLHDGDPLLRRDAVRSFRSLGGHAEMVELLSRQAPRLIDEQPGLAHDLSAVVRAWLSNGVKWKGVALPNAPADDAAYARIVAEDAFQQAHPALGRRVFERSGCVKCHTTVVEDTERAPSLKGIGKAQKVEYLVESVLDPSAVIKTGFETELIVTRDGKVHSGLVKEVGESLRVILAEGETRLDKADIEERSVQKKSLMPDGQHRLLSLAEFADLIAYLQSLK